MNQRRSHQLGRRDGAAGSCPGMIRPGDHHQLVVRDSPVIQTRIGVWPFDKPHVDGSCQHIPDDIGGVHRLHPYPCFGVEAPEGQGPGRNQILGNRHRGRDRDRGALAAQQRVDPGREPFRRVEQTRCPLQHCDAFRRQLCARRRPAEEHHTQFAFHGMDACADGLLAEVLLAGGGAHTALPCH